MKKYKLIETYPGSPELNTIKEAKLIGGELCVYQAMGYFPIKEWIGKHWEEVIEKDYEILKVLYYNKIYDRFDGTFHFDEKASCITDDIPFGNINLNFRSKKAKC